MRMLSAAFLVLTLVAFARSAPSSRAQTPGEYQVLIPYSAIQQPSSSATQPNLGTALISLVAYADGQPCAFVNLSTVASDVLLRIGGPGQPPNCSEEGAVITFVDGAGRGLTTTFNLEKGTRDVLTNLSSLPRGVSPMTPTPTATATPIPTSTPTSSQLQSLGLIRPPSTGDGGLQ